MTKEQKIEAYSMLLDGKSFREIAKNFDVSYQRIQQIFPFAAESRRIEKYKSFLYPNIADYMRSNNLSIRAFSEKCGITAQGMASLLNGANSTRKKTIDAILAVTGMTYEQAFSTARRENEEID